MSRELINQKPETDSPIRVVDLFCGGGGLSCGFDFFDGPIRYQTVLGLDNDPAAIRIYNQNFLFVGERGAQPVGRLVDLTWFRHPVEIRLFYLVHLSIVTGDAKLVSALEQLGLSSFLNDLRTTDEDFQSKLDDICSDEEYLKSLESIHSATFTLALAKSFLGRLGITSLNRPKLSERHLPWIEDYQNPKLERDKKTAGRLTDRDPMLFTSIAKEWDTRLQELRQAASKLGHGQNSNNSSRVRSLVTFLDSDSGVRMKETWIAWRAKRDTIRAQFCLANKSAIDGLYFKDYHVNLVLGGPPCKGFSRIGRPVIQSLRDQGVHAWSHDDFGDERNALMFQYVLFLEALRPDAFVFENVSNFQSVLETPNGTLDAPAVLEELISDLSNDNLHYHIQHQVLNSRKFCIPQDRRRFIMFGANAAKAPAKIAEEFFRFGASSKEVPLQAALTGLGAADAFDTRAGVTTAHQTDVYQMSDPNLPSELKTYYDWIQKPDPHTGSQVKKTTAHIFREPRADDKTFIGFVAPGIRWMDLKVDRSETLADLRSVLSDCLEQDIAAPLRARLRKVLDKVDGSLLLRLLLEHTKERFGLEEQHLLLEGYLKNGGASHGDWLERLSASKPCRTIVAHIGKDTYAYWHPTEPRALTIREAARVQSFPDFFKLDSAGVVDTYSVIGNAVPPLLARMFAESLSRLDARYGLFTLRTPQEDTRKVPASR